MGDQTRSTKMNLDELADQQDTDGRKTYLTVYADLRDKDWQERLKGRAESFRFEIGAEDAKEANFHKALDQAFIAVERIAQQGAKGAVVFVSPVHDLEVAQPLDRPVETEFILDSRPQTGPLEKQG